MQNVILLSLDTTRADHLSCHGWGRTTTPHLDRLAQRGTRFAECHSTWTPTHPAHTTLFTGVDIHRHRIVAQGAKTELSPEVPTLAELLRGAGYWTGAADNLQRWFPRGFDDYRSYQWAPEADGSWRKAEAVNRLALELLETARSQPRPFFLFFHYWDAHTPYRPPAPFDRLFYGGDERDPAHRTMEDLWKFEPFRWYFQQWLPGVTDIEYPKALYDGSLSYLDLTLSHLWNWLDAHNLWDETLVVITADHGEEMDEHRMWFDHHGLYNTNTHIPLIFHQPGVVPAGLTVPGLVRLLDVAPTVLDLLGLSDLAAQHAMLGQSLVPGFHGEPVGSKRLYMTECTWMRKRAVRTPEWKLIVARDHPDLHGCPPLELYHQLTDPSEQRNVAEQHPEVVRELREELDAWNAERTADTGLPDPIELQGITLTQIGQPPQGKGGRP